MDRRWLYGVLIVFATALLIGSGSFSAMSADRGVSVAVADDPEAYVGYETSCNGQTLEITITNQFNNDFEGIVTVDGTQESFGQLSPGEASKVDFKNVDDGDPITVTVWGESVSAELDRSVEKRCHPQSAEGVTFRGEGKAHINISESGPFNVTYWILDDGNLTENTEDDVEDVQVSSETVVAVYIAATNKTYIHPNLVYDAGYKITGGQGSNTPTDCVVNGNMKPDQEELDSCS